MRPFLLALLLGFAPPEPTPAPPPPPPPAEAPAATPAAEPDAAAVSGDEVLARAVSALTAGDYEDALAIAIPAISAYPELAASFHAVADVAADQIERRRLFEGQPAVDVEGAGEHAAAAYPPAYYPTPQPYGYRPRDRDRVKLLWGFDAGFPSGLRLEWKIARSAVDSVGVRIGGNALLYGGAVYAVTDSTAFLDFKLSEKWQLETTAGFLVYYGWTYPQGGVAAQYDPPSPLHVNAGLRLSLYGSVLPDVSVGFVW
jgi:hypothetical protein